VGTHPKIAILKQLKTLFKAKREKGVGTPFPRVPAPALTVINFTSHELLRESSHNSCFSCIFA